MRKHRTHTQPRVQGKGHYGRRAIQQIAANHEIIKGESVRSDLLTAIMKEELA